MKGLKNLFIGEDESDQIEFQTYGAQNIENRPTNVRNENSYAERQNDFSYITNNQASSRRSGFERPDNYPQREYNNSRNTSYNNDYQESERVMNVEHTQTLQIVLARPVDFSEVREIGDDINEFKTVILNLEMVKSDDAKRILDFLSGVAYANKAQIKMMAQKTFAIMSKNVKFDGKDLMTELENNGYSF